MNIDDPGVKDWSIYTSPRGSRAYNLATEESDFDVMVICVPPIGYYAGLESYGSKGTKEIKEDGFDVVSYECRKFFSLVLKGNPSVLEILWTPKHRVISNEAGDLIRDNRELFIGRHVYSAFKGMACGHIAKQRTDDPDWKDWMHTIRLLRMGVEFLTDGDMQVYRSADRDELMAIRDGLVSVERLEQEAQRLLNSMKEAFLSTSLPAEPDYKRASELCAEVIQRAHELRV